MIMRELLVATGNPGKLREIRELLADLDLTITSLADYPDLPEIVEDQDNFAGNAMKKALTIGRETGKLVMGEDSGLAVDALDGRPGIYSARYSDPDASDEKNNAKLLKELADVPLEQRTARYHCCAALAEGDNEVGVVEGRCEGVIAFAPRGKNGFGYDPLFMIREYESTFGELAPNVKALISHRAQALRKFRDLLTAHLKK